MIIPEKQNIEFKENTIQEVKSGILIMESKRHQHMKVL